MKNPSTYPFSTIHKGDVNVTDDVDSSEESYIQSTIEEIHHIIQDHDEKLLGSTPDSDFLENSGDLGEGGQHNDTNQVFRSLHKQLDEAIDYIDQFIKRQVREKKIMEEIDKRHQKELDNPTFHDMIHSDTMILIWCLLIMIVLGLILRYLMNNLVRIRKSKERYQDSLKEIATNMHTVTKTLSVQQPGTLDMNFAQDSPSLVTRKNNSGSFSGSTSSSTDNSNNGGEDCLVDERNNNNRAMDQREFIKLSEMNSNGTNSTTLTDITSDSIADDVSSIPKFTSPKMDINNRSTNPDLNAIRKSGYSLTDFSNLMKTKDEGDVAKIREQKMQQRRQKKLAKAKEKEKRIIDRRISKMETYLIHER